MRILDAKDNVILETFGEHILEEVFLTTKNIIYHPTFTILHPLNDSSMYVESVFELIEKQKNLIDDPGFKDHLLKLLKGKLSIEGLNDVVKIIKNTPDSKSIINNIFKSYDKILEYVVNTKRNEQESEEQQESEEEYDPYGNPEIQESINLFSSIKLPAPQPEQEKFQIVEKKVEIKIEIKKYSIRLSKPTEKNESYLETVFNKIALTEKLVCVGIDIQGSRFKKIKSDNKNTVKHIKLFMNSEHKIGDVKKLAPGIFYFLFIVDETSRILGELRPGNVLVLSVYDDTNVSEISSIQDKCKLSFTEISSIFKTLIPEMILEISNPYKISVKIRSAEGILDKNTIVDNFRENQKSSHKGIIIRFDLQLSNGNLVKDIIYSENNGYSTFNVKNIETKEDIQQILVKIKYPFKDSIVKVKEKIKEKKEAIKELKNANIPYIPRECPKNRKIDILSPEDLVQADRKTTFNGVELVCKNNDYPYPGLTKKNNIPCCFKRPQTSPETTDKYTSINITEILKNRPSQTEGKKLKQFSIAGIDNILLKSIFPTVDGYYSLTISNVKKSLKEFLSFIFGEKIIQDSINALTPQDTIYYSIKSKESDEDILKIVSLYKKLNIIVVKYDSRGSAFLCSMTKYLTNDDFMIILRYDDNHKLLVNNKNGLIIRHSKTGDNIKKFVKKFNSSCIIGTGCDEYIPDLRTISIDIAIKAAVIDPKTEKIIMVETENYGVIPINPSFIIGDIKTKSIKELQVHTYEYQKQKIEELSRKYDYLKETMPVFSQDQTKITGIAIKCGFIIPTIPIAHNLEPENTVYYKTVEEGVFGEELEMVDEKMLMDYESSIETFCIDYYNKTPYEKADILKYVNAGDFDAVSNKIVDKITKIKFVDFIFPKNLAFPLPVVEERYTTLLSTIVWKIMNYGEFFFEQKIENEEKSFDTSLIPDIEEVVVD